MQKKRTKQTKTQNKNIGCDGSCDKHKKRNNKQTDKQTNKKEMSTERKIGRNNEKHKSCSFDELLSKTSLVSIHMQISRRK